MESTLDPRLSEFATQSEAERYDIWFREKVAAARQSPVVSHQEALAHFERKRAERLEQLKNA